MTRHALIVGAGSGISAEFARALAGRGYKVALAARRTDKLSDLVSEIDGVSLACDAADAGSVEAMFGELDTSFGPLDLVHYNASLRFKAPLVELDPGDVKNALMVSAYGGFLVAQQAARRMLGRGEGAIFFTGASASVKGYAESAPFAMGKFALRGLAQSMARELHPQNIHIAHFVIDGGVRSEARGRVDTAESPDRWLDPAAIAATYLHILEQPRSVWTWEVEMRPWVERF